MDSKPGFFSHQCQPQDEVILPENYIFCADGVNGDAMAKLNRRNFILGTASMTLLTSAYASFRQIGEYPISDLNLPHLSDKEIHIYSIIGSWLIPESSLLPGFGGDEETIQGIDELFAFVPEGKRFLLSALPLAFEHGTALEYFGARSLSQLSSEEQIQYLTSNYFKLSDAEDIGVIANDNEKKYSRFTNRIMFPIRTHSSKLAGFSGRITDGERAKYLNSPATKLFDKSRVGIYTKSYNFISFL